MPRPTRAAVPFLAAAMFAILPGCGSDLEWVLFQSATAAGQTVLDQLITEVANSVAEACDREDTPPQDGGDDDQNGDDDDDGDGGDGTDGSPFDDLTGDPAAGEPSYASCTACHCADAVGGCVPGTPGVVGATPEALDDYLRGDRSHVPSDLTDQEIVDLAAYLASF